MDAYEVSKYLQSVDVLETMEGRIVIGGDKFIAYDAKGSILGHFNTIDALYHFVLGFTTGYNIGKYYGKS